MRRRESGREKENEEKTGPRGSEKDASFRIGGSRPNAGERKRGWGKREGERELDVRTNAICMILHVLARPDTAPIGFQLSAYVFCLLFWLYGMVGTRVVESEGKQG